MEWPAVVTAVSTTVIALVALVLGFGILFLFRDFSRTMASLERLLRSLETDARPALESARQVAEAANKVVGSLRSEVDGIVDTSQDIRSRVLKAADAVEDRLLDLDAILDIVQTEVEETVLDVTAALRTGRRGRSVLKAMKRAIVGRRR